jgi:hypothetical protein
MRSHSKQGQASAVICYLSTPGSMAQAQAAQGAAVLISYAYVSPWLMEFTRSFRRVLWDSGAYTAYTKGKVIDLDAYAETARAIPWSDGAASLDDIAGDWKKGLANWDRYPWMFPVYHDSDPPEALDAILVRTRRLSPASSTSGTPASSYRGLARFVAIRPRCSP